MIREQFNLNKVEFYKEQCATVFIDGMHYAFEEADFEEQLIYVSTKDGELYPALIEEVEFVEYTVLRDVE